MTVMRAGASCLFAPLRVAKKRPLAAFLLWHALCAAALYTPNLSSGPMPFPFADKAVHFLLFSGLYAVTLPLAGAPVPALFFSGGGYGLLSECVQGLFITGRGFAVGDVFADLLGSSAALCAAAACARAGEKKARVPEREHRAAA